MIFGDFQRGGCQRHGQRHGQHHWPGSSRQANRSTPPPSRLTSFAALLSLSLAATGWLPKRLTLAAQAQPPSPAALSEPTAPPALFPADFLPENTPLAFLVSTRPEYWETLKQFELFASIADLSGEAFTQGWLSLLPGGRAYEGELPSQVGEQIAIALLPDTTPRSIALSDLSTSAYTVVPLKQGQALPELLTHLENWRLVPPEESTYEGISLWVWPTVVEQDFGLEEMSIPHEELKHSGRSSQKTSGKPAMGTSPSPAAKARSAPPPLPWPEDFGPDTQPYRDEIPGLAVALIEDYLVLSQEPETIKTLIDYQRSTVGKLGKSDQFRRPEPTDNLTLSQYAQDKGAIARLYINFSELLQFNLDGGLPGGSPSGSPGGLPRLPLPLPNFPSLPALSPFSMGTEDRLAAAGVLRGISFDALVYPQTEGLRLESRVYGNGLLRSQISREVSYADSVLRFVPAPTYALGSGRDLKGVWQQIASALSLNGATRATLAKLREAALGLTGLDLDTELLGWMDREFALFFFPSDQGAINSLLPEAQMEIGLALQTSDRAAAQKAIDALDALVGPAIATPITLNSSPAVSWQWAEASPTGLSTQLPAGVSMPATSYLSHGWIAEDTLVITSGAGAMAKLLNAPAFEPIDRHPTFLNTTGPLPHPNEGYGYLNTSATFSWFYNLLEKWLNISPNEPFFQIVKSYLGTVRGLGSTTAGTERYTQFDVLLNLAPDDPSYALGWPMPASLAPNADGLAPPLPSPQPLEPLELEPLE